MLKIAFIAITVALLGACSVSPNEANTALAANGYHDIKLEGYALFGCGHHDDFKTVFEATNAQGVHVKGVVCKEGFFGGSTVKITG